jgi:hypothetical protein
VYCFNRFLIDRNADKATTFAQNRRAFPNHGRRNTPEWEKVFVDLVVIVDGRAIPIFSILIPFIKVWRRESMVSGFVRGYSRLKATARRGLIRPVIGVSLPFVHKQTNRVEAYGLC